MVIGDLVDIDFTYGAKSLLLLHTVRSESQCRRQTKPTCSFPLELRPLGLQCQPFDKRRPITHAVQMRMQHVLQSKPKLLQGSHLLLLSLLFKARRSHQSLTMEGVDFHHVMMVMEVVAEGVVEVAGQVGSSFLGFLPF
ncbi:hypothetical protein CsSME_00025963 [Camellia sinensis var. sinensis]